MNREIHVRFCERLGVRFPWATRPVAESFFSTLKTELVHNVIFMTKASAKTAIAEWIGIFYNGKRRHSSVGLISPVECERRYYETLIAAKAA